ncbi:unnamed protein product [Amoebophrya sp. A120]|nr:unnamed protein product [Amoebophrya sp. A120]|eukprot:GSA120T00005143001.1
MRISPRPRRMWLRDLLVAFIGAGFLFYDPALSKKLLGHDDESTRDGVEVLTDKYPNDGSKNEKILVPDDTDDKQLPSDAEGGGTKGARTAELRSAEDYYKEFFPGAYESEQSSSTTSDGEEDVQDEASEDEDPGGGEDTTGEQEHLPLYGAEDLLRRSARNSTSQSGPVVVGNKTSYPYTEGQTCEDGKSFVVEGMTTSWIGHEAKPRFLKTRWWSPKIDADPGGYVYADTTAVMPTAGRLKKWRFLPGATVSGPTPATSAKPALRLMVWRPSVGKPGTMPAAKQQALFNMELVCATIATWKPPAASSKRGEVVEWEHPKDIECEVRKGDLLGWETSRGNQRGGGSSAIAPAVLQYDEANIDSAVRYFDPSRFEKAGVSTPSNVYAMAVDNTDSSSTASGKKKNNPGASTTAKASAPPAFINALQVGVEQEFSSGGLSRFYSLEALVEHPDGSCRDNVCVCANGIGVVGGAECDQEGKNVCLSCDAGFNLLDRECLPTQCSCANGVVDPHCTVDEPEKCLSCDAGWKIVSTNSTCVKQGPCVCDNGTPNGEPVCPAAGFASCQECDTGFYLSDDKDRCVPNPPKIVVLNTTTSTTTTTTTTRLILSVPLSLLSLAAVGKNPGTGGNQGRGWLTQDNNSGLGSFYGSEAALEQTKAPASLFQRAARNAATRHTMVNPGPFLAQSRTHRAKPDSTDDLEDGSASEEEVERHQAETAFLATDADNSEKISSQENRAKKDRRQDKKRNRGKNTHRGRQQPPAPSTTPSAAAALSNTTSSFPVKPSVCDELVLRPRGGQPGAPQIVTVNNASYAQLTAAGCDPVLQQGTGLQGANCRNITLATIDAARHRLRILGGSMELDRLEIAGDFALESCTTTPFLDERLGNWQWRGSDVPPDGVLQPTRDDLLDGTGSETLSFKAIKCNRMLVRKKQDEPMVPVVALSDKQKAETVVKATDCQSMSRFTERDGLRICGQDCSDIEVDVGGWDVMENAIEFCLEGCTNEIDSEKANRPGVPVTKQRFKPSPLSATKANSTRDAVPTNTTSANLLSASGPAGVAGKLPSALAPTPRQLLRTTSLPAGSLSPPPAATTVTAALNVKFPAKQEKKGSAASLMAAKEAAPVVFSSNANASPGPASLAKAISDAVQSSISEQAQAFGDKDPHNEENDESDLRRSLRSRISHDTSDGADSKEPAGVTGTFGNHEGEPIRPLETTLLENSRRQIEGHEKQMSASPFGPRGPEVLSQSLLVNRDVGGGTEGLFSHSSFSPSATPPEIPTSEEELLAKWMNDQDGRAKEPLMQEQAAATSRKDEDSIEPPSGELSPWQLQQEVSVPALESVPSARGVVDARAIATSLPSSTSSSSTTRLSNPVLDETEIGRGRAPGGDIKGSIQLAGSASTSSALQDPPRSASESSAYSPFQPATDTGRQAGAGPLGSFSPAHQVLAEQSAMLPPTGTTSTADTSSTSSSIVSSPDPPPLRQEPNENKPPTGIVEENTFRFLDMIGFGGSSDKRGSGTSEGGSGSSPGRLQRLLEETSAAKQD